jgi:predicted O-methyltransferase YrrM
MGTVTYRQGNVTPFELFCLRAITQITQPRTIFEFGTFDGATTLALARSAPSARVYTFDLPTADAALGAHSPVEIETEVRRAGEVGSCFTGQPEESRITQLWGDSLTFDYGEYAGSVDLVFVDASHEEAFVASDTENALRMVAPGGIVLWHDYTIGWPGVRLVVDRLIDAGENVIRLESTSLALLQR